MATTTIPPFVSYDLDSTQPGTQHFTLSGAIHVSHAADDLIVRTTADSTVVYGDANGDGVADFALGLRAGRSICPRLHAVVGGSST